MAIIMFSFVGLASADILNPIGPSNSKVTFTTPTAFNSGTILTDAATIINYLGVTEGEVYSFENHSWVTTTGTTIVTYAPWNLSLGIAMLNTDGVVADIAYNLGAVLPSANVPLLKYTQYLYVIGGIGGEENTEGTAFKLAPVIGAEFKFSF